MILNFVSIKNLEFIFNATYSRARDELIMIKNVNEVIQAYKKKRKHFYNVCNYMLTRRWHIKLANDLFFYSFIFFLVFINSDASSSDIKESSIVLIQWYWRDARTTASERTRNRLQWSLIAAVHSRGFQFPLSKHFLLVLLMVQNEGRWQRQLRILYRQPSFEPTIGSSLQCLSGYSMKYMRLSSHECSWEGLSSLSQMLVKD